MKKLKLLIVDDEPLAHKVLENYCEKIDYVEVAGNCYDGLSTLNFLNQEPVDALLLDIQMPDLTGLELLDTLREKAPKIIFTTAFTDYALQSFEYDQVIDYLHKPVRITRFIKALERLKKQLQLEQEVEAPTEEVLEPVSPKETSAHISLKDNKIFYKVPFDELLYVQSWGNYIKVFLKGEEMKLIRKTIAKMETELPAELFERVHKSYLVNMQHVSALDGNQLLVGDQYLPIGKSYRVAVLKRFQ